jgi:hypothetical protein
VANSRSVETRELNRGNPYARSGRMDKHIVPVFDISNQDKSLKSFPCPRSTPSPERDSIWGQLGRANLALTCNESLWNARGLHPRQLRRFAEDLRFWYSNIFCIGTLNQEKDGWKLGIPCAVRTPAVLTHPRCKTEDLVTYCPCR